MSIKHNKKRNSLLVYEFLVRTMASALVENDTRKSKTALRITKRFYKPGTELYKEFRLLNAMANSNVSTQAVAGSILAEAKSAAVNLDAQRLEREKSLLMKNINESLPSDFYDQHVPRYKDYATVQILVNEWKNSDRDVTSLVRLENQFVGILTENRLSDDNFTVTEDAPGTTRLIMSVLTKKLNDKYRDALNDSQRSILKSYVYSTAHSDTTAVASKLSEVKKTLLGKIETYCLKESCNEFLRAKLIDAKSRISSEDVDNVNDDLITRFMVYTKLSSELSEESVS